MNKKEITKEILNDLGIINNSTTIERLMFEYYDERKRAKVKKDEAYTKFYEIKTKSKNKWIIQISKDHLLEKYLNPEDCIRMLYTYYYNELSIRLFTNYASGGILVVNGHFFQRYRERMNLNIPNSMDVVKKYFENNYTASYKYMPEKDGKCQFLALVKDGFVKGEYVFEDRWFVYKTFISKATSNCDANTFEIDSINTLKDQLMNNDKGMNNDNFIELMSIYKTLKPL